MNMKDRIEQLKNEYKNINDDLAVELLSDLINQSNDYVNCVVNMENQITLLRFKLDGYDYRMAVQNLDQNRRIIHNALIVTVKAVNRMLESDSKEILFTGDISDRYQIADFAGVIVNDYFTNRTL